MILPFRRFFDFSGRSRRMEFWMFTLLSVLASIAATVVDIALGFSFDDVGPVASIVSLAFLIPSLSVSFRRLHDVDRSAWWLLLVFLPIIGWIVLLVWNCSDGTSGPNRFGPDPKNPDGDLQAVFS
jgi:uncharacterized membrane protein YhaH (DUF805 family)